MSAEIETVRRGQFWGTLVKKAREHRIPLSAMIELTYGCNLACVHCFNPTHRARGELATKEIYRILDQLAEAGCLKIGFTGGELLTRRDVFEIFRYAEAKGFTISILTNATLVTPERADQIQALRSCRVEISIYGATAETYDRVTRVPGSFHNFLRGVELLRDRGIPLVVKMPVMTLNAHEVTQARALVESWGIKFVFCTEIHPRVDGSLEPLQYRLPPEEALRVERELVGARKWKAEGGGEKEQDCPTQQGLFTCKCGKSTLAVTPYGEMNLCVIFPIPKYDLKSGDVSSGWKTLVDLVDSASATPSEAYECSTCELRRYCRQGPVNAWLETGDFSPCLPHFKELAGLEKQADESARQKNPPREQDPLLTDEVSQA